MVVASGGLVKDFQSEKAGRCLSAGIAVKIEFPPARFTRFRTDTEFRHVRNLRFLSAARKKPKTLYEIPMTICRTARYSRVTDARFRQVLSGTPTCAIPGHEADALIPLKYPPNTIRYGVGPTFLITGEYRTVYWVYKHVSRYRVTEYKQNNNTDDDDKTNSSWRRVTKYLRTNLLIAPIALLINSPAIVAIIACLSFSITCIDRCAG